MRTARAVLWALWLPLALTLWWWIGSQGSQSIYFPPLSSILSMLWDNLTQGMLLSDIAFSLGNLAAGLIIACALGIALGLVLGECDTLRHVVDPMLNFLRAVPQSAIIPVVIIAFGLGPGPKIFIIAFACLWPILLNTVDGVLCISTAVRETAMAYRIPPHLLLWRVTLPAALPQIAAGIRVALSMGLTLMVVSELYGADRGLGYYILESGQRFAVAETWGGTLVAGALGYGLNTLFLFCERHLLGWYFRTPRRGRSGIEAQT